MERTKLEQGNWTVIHPLVKLQKRKIPKTNDQVTKTVQDYVYRILTFLF